MKRRICSVVMILVLCLAMLPAGALADEPEQVDGTPAEDAPETEESAEDEAPAEDGESLGDEEISEDGEPVEDEATFEEEESIDNEESFEDEETVGDEESINDEEPAGDEPVTVAADEPITAAVEGTMSGADFLAAAESGTITLTGDVTLDSTATLNTGDNITIDLNGHTLTRSSAAVLTVNTGAELTIKDSSNNAAGVISCPASNALSGAIKLNGTAALTVESGTIDAPKTSAIYGAATSTVTIKGGTIKGTLNASLTNAAAAVTLEGGSFEGDFAPTTYNKFLPAGKVVIISAGEGSPGSTATTVTSGKVTKYEFADSYSGNYIAYRTIEGHMTYLTEGDLKVLMSTVTVYDDPIHVVADSNIFYAFSGSLVTTPNATNQLDFDIAPGVTVGGRVVFNGYGRITWSGGGYFDDGAAADKSSDYLIHHSEDEEAGTKTITMEVGNPVAKIGDISYPSLASAVLAAKANTETTIVMLQDEALASQVQIGGARNIVLDLDGHTLSSDKVGALMVAQGSSLTVTGGGTVSTTPAEADLAAIYVMTSTSQTKLTIDSGVTVSGPSAVLIQPQKVNGVTTDESSMSAQVTVYGTLSGTDHGLSVQGQLEKGTGIVKVMSGATITGSTGIYAAGHSDITVNNGAAITGSATGIEIRAGKLTVNGGTITSTAGSLSVNPNNSGTTTVGAGIAVAQHVTKLPVEVIINGGTITGYVGLNIADPEKNNLSKDIDMDVAGGDFIAKGDGEDSVSVNVQGGYGVSGFVSGGNFSDSLLETGYLDKSLEAELHSVKKNEDAPYSYYPSMTDALNDAVDGDTVTHVGTMESPETPVPITFNAGYDEISIVVYTALADTLTLPENQYFKHPDGLAFLGWKIDGEGSLLLAGDVIDLPAEGVTLVAQWGVPEEEPEEEPDETPEEELDDEPQPAPTDKTEPTPTAKPQDTVPATGDETALLPWILLLAVSLTGVTLTALLRRKGRKQ